MGNICTIQVIILWNFVCCTEITFCLFIVNFKWLWYKLIWIARPLLCIVISLEISVILMKPFWIMLFIFWRASVLAALAKGVEPCCWSCLFWAHNICRFYFNFYYCNGVIVAGSSGTAWVGCTWGERGISASNFLFSPHKNLAKQKKGPCSYPSCFHHNNRFKISDKLFISFLF